MVLVWLLGPTPLVWSTFEGDVILLEGEEGIRGGGEELVSVAYHASQMARTRSDLCREICVVRKPRAPKLSVTKLLGTVPPKH